MTWPTKEDGVGDGREAVASYERVTRPVATRWSLTHLAGTREDDASW